MVVWLAPAPFVPVVVPPSEPLPEATESETFDAVVTLLAVPHGSVEVTVTEKLDVFAVGVASTSFVGAPSVTVNVALVPAASAGGPLGPRPEYEPPPCADDDLSPVNKG